MSRVIARMMNQNGRDPMSAHIQEPWFDLLPFPRFILVHAGEQAADIVQDNHLAASSQGQSEQILLLRPISEIHCLTGRLEKNLVIDD